MVPRQPGVPHGGGDPGERADTGGGSGKREGGSGRPVADMAHIPDTYLYVLCDSLSNTGIYK